METPIWVQEMQHQNKLMKIQRAWEEETRMDDDEIYDELCDLVRESKMQGVYKDQLRDWLIDARTALRRGE